MKKLLIILIGVITLNANAQISNLTPMTDPVAVDKFHIYDVSDGASESITYGELFKSVPLMHVGAPDDSFTIVNGSVTSTPKIAVEQDDQFNAAYAIHGVASAGSVSSMRHNGTVATKTILAADDVVMKILAGGFDGTDFEIATLIESTISTSGTVGAGSMPGKLTLGATPDGGFSPATMATFDGGENKVTLQSTNGDTLIKITGADGDIDLTANNDISITTKNGSTNSGGILIDAGGDFTGITNNAGTTIATFRGATTDMVVNAITSSTADSDLTLSGNGDGGVVIDSLFVSADIFAAELVVAGDGITSIAIDEPATITLVNIDDPDSPSANSEGDSLGYVQYSGHDGTEVRVPVRTGAKSATGCGLGFNDFAGEYTIETAADNSVTPNGASLKVDGCADKISLSANAVQADGYVQVGTSTETCIVGLIGAIRYRATANDSYAEMCMQSGASTYAWTVMKTLTW